MSISVSLGSQWDSYVKELVAGGSYASASEVLRAGLRLLREQEDLKRVRLQRLGEEIRKGDESGIAGPAQVVMPRALARAKARVAAKKAKR
jgi:antitoxin ParD1/3/4